MSVYFVKRLTSSEPTLILPVTSRQRTAMKNIKVTQGGGCIEKRKYSECKNDTDFRIEPHGLKFPTILQDDPEPIIPKA